jgi:hypothetical protein
MALPQGLKPNVDFAAFSARLKPCPVTKLSIFVASMSFSAACEALDFIGVFAARRPRHGVGTPVVPCYKTADFRGPNEFLRNL